MSSSPTRQESHPAAWPAFGSLVIGFFMILLDATIVTVAMPRLMADLHASITDAVWVTSAYLLACAVPLLITGRLGDRLGPKRVYLAGLAVFTVSSLWCGLSGDIGMLILARAVQGFGAALMSPQTMSVITRLFPPDRRGMAMGLWGSVAGVATAIGPIAGGLIVDGLGWEWIFFVNVPVGIIGFLAVLRFVPNLETTSRKLDWIGVALSAIAMFCIVFALQEGARHEWGSVPITIGDAAIAVPLVPTLVLGTIVLAVFIWWQTRADEPLVPLALFRERNFTGANITIMMIGAISASIMIPIMLYAQDVLGLTPTEAAMVVLPSAVIGFFGAPIVGRLQRSVSNRLLASIGVISFTLSSLWYAFAFIPNQSVWMLVAVSALMGVANSFTWGPTSTTAMRDISPSLSGAASGVYNTTRQTGSVVGTAALTSVMSARIAANLDERGVDAGSTGQIEAASGGADLSSAPPEMTAAYAAGLGEAMLLLVALGVIGSLSIFIWEPYRRSTEKA